MANDGYWQLNDHMGMNDNYIFDACIEQSYGAG